MQGASAFMNERVVRANTFSKDCSMTVVIPLYDQLISQSLCALVPARGTCFRSDHHRDHLSFCYGQTKTCPHYEGIY